MLGYFNLRKTVKGWEFESEVVLEDFVWANLEKLFGWKPLARQYSVKGQYCDILALGENRQLVILELKNTEDRYIVQQLTRYYDALKDIKPFQETIDYERPICLVAIAPSFHKDNLVDIKYHQLFFQFFEFKIINSPDKYYFKINNLIGGLVFPSLTIDYQQKANNELFSNIPKALLNLLKNCTNNEQKTILKIRQKFLNVDKRIQEVIQSGYIKYIKGKNNILAELSFDKQRMSLAFFMVLPFATNLNHKKKMARMRIFTNWETVSNICYVPKGTRIIITKNEWLTEQIIAPVKLLPSCQTMKDLVISDKQYRHNYIKSINKHSYQKPYWNGLAMPLDEYYKLINKEFVSDSIEYLVDFALENWLQKL